jgi:Fur family ferric uptake transcriptional regulator
MFKTKKIYNDLLETVGLKKTKHRLLLLDILHQTDSFLTADDLYEQAKKIEKKINLSTVYRILESFCDNHICDVVNIPDSKQQFYELHHEHHSHHLICTKCHKVVHIEGCPIKGYDDIISQEYGFDVNAHNLEFFGLCPECQNRDKVLNE